MCHVSMHSLKFYDYRGINIPSNPDPKKFKGLILSETIRGFPSAAQSSVSTLQENANRNQSNANRNQSSANRNQSNANRNQSNANRNQSNQSRVWKI